MSDFSDLILQYAPKPGGHGTGVEGVYVFRADEPTIRTPTIYDPSVVIVGQGAKCAYTDEASFRYDPDNYLILFAPLPLGSQVVAASPESPFLCLLVDIDVKRPQPIQTAISSSTMTAAIASAAYRLLQSAGNDKDRRILGPIYKRELLYLLLEGDQGAFLHELAMLRGNFYEIATVMEKIHQNCSEAFDVESMAQEANMGVSTFFANFKAATSFSPMQYVKLIRLTKAHALMVEDQLNASEAAHLVGYHSASQFSREFKRLFGFPPKAVRRSEGGTPF